MEPEHIGRNVREYPPCLMKDARSMCVPYGCDVAVHSALTGKRISIIKTGRDFTVTAISLLVDYPTHIVVATLQGLIYRFDVSDFKQPRLIQTVNMLQPIWRLDCRTVPGNCVIVCESAKRFNLELFIVTLDQLFHQDYDANKTAAVARWNAQIAGVASRKQFYLLPQGIPFAVSMEYAAFFDYPRPNECKTGTLTIVSLKNPDIVVKHNNVPQVTSLKFHPCEPYIAMGCKTGHILLMYNFFKKQESVVSSLHWHVHHVRCIAFSPDGAYMMSGGEEGVLVSWQLETGHKQFYPRLGGSLDYIVVSQKGDTYALSIGDNTIKMFDSVKNSTCASIRGLQSPDRRVEHWFRNKEVIIAGPGSPTTVLIATSFGMIQEYNAWEDHTVNCLQLVEWNHVSRANARIHVSRPFKVHFAHKIGEVELIDVVEEFGEFIQLQFWNNNKLITSIENPHRDSVTGLAVDPQNDRCITSSLDGTFKVWRKVCKKIALKSISSESANGEEHISYENQWELFNAGEYQNLPCMSVSCSVDGSLIAASFGTVVTFWDAKDCVLLNSFNLPSELSGEEKRVFNQLAFVGSSHLVVSCEGVGVFVWDCLRMTLAYFVKGNVLKIAADSFHSNKFAVLEKQKYLQVRIYDVNHRKALCVKDLKNEKLMTATLAFQRKSEQSDQSFVILCAQDGDQVFRVSVPNNKFDGQEQVAESSSEIRQHQSPEEVSLVSKDEKPEKLSGTKRKRPISFDDMLNRFTTVRSIASLT
eukprot:TRINITY_DN37112_c0_g1_i1.p1 TRINITY_DN37112_c0_g1~~TRINITY_DN37112_c0_g1_i1.p1  ORF type:complete len:775 (-),score=163.82 TRINITY_DN37112_c0_g1_i1:144-2405(-)